MLEIKTVSSALPEIRQCVALYRRAFPLRERFPLWLLRLLARRNCADFLAFYDGGTLCAMAYLIYCRELTYVLYLAVDDSLRSKGYGSQVLSIIKEKYPAKTMALSIERADSSAPDDQPARRLRFYQRNGFTDTGLLSVQGGESYQVLCCGGPFDPARYKALIHQFTFGLYADRLRIRRPV